MRTLRYQIALLQIAVAGVCSLEVGGLRLSRRQDASTDKDQAMCWWMQPSAALIRDTIYVDGGNLDYVDASQLTSTTRPQPNYGPKPYTYTLNLTSAFTVGHNSKNPPKFQTIPKTYPNLYDGFMAANDFYFLLYGGYIRYSSSITSIPDADETAQYQAFLQGPQRVFTAGYQGATLSGVSRYVGSGAGVNVRELNMSYYFSGLRSPTWGEIRGNGAVPANLTANVTSNQLISVDMNSEVTPLWKNTTARSPARGRTNPEMVYVPVGKKGALVVVGGVLYPDWMNPDPTAAQARERTRTATSFLESVDVYDIETGNWYLQNTTGDIPPSGMTQFCATLASSSDGSSHQIYVYGGYSGTEGASGYSDDVYILSLPAFQWIKAYSGSDSGLKSHKCVKVYPDQMFVIGGANIDRTCNKNGIVSVFNLNSLTFQDSYDPTKYSEYEVPSVVYKEIGGDGKGSATKTADWADSDLRSMFQSNTPSATAVAWYPYQSVKAPSSAGGSGTPKYVWPLVGTLIGVLLVVIIGCIAFFLIRRKKKRQYEQEFSEGSGPSFSVDKASGSTRLQNWLGGITPGAAPSTIGDHPSNMSESDRHGTVSSAVSPLSHNNSILRTNSSAYGDHYATKDGQVHELPATQEVVELDSSEISSPEGTVTSRPVANLPTVQESPNAPVPNTPIDTSSPAEGLEVAPNRIDIKPDTPVEKNFGADSQR